MIQPQEVITYHLNQGNRLTHLPETVKFWSIIGRYRSRISNSATYTDYDYKAIQQLTLIKQPAPGRGIVVGSHLGLESLYLGKIGKVYEKRVSHEVIEANLRIFKNPAQIRDLEDFTPEPADWIKITQVPEIMETVLQYPEWLLETPVIYLECPSNTKPLLDGFTATSPRSRWYIRRNKDGSQQNKDKEKTPRRQEEARKSQGLTAINIL